jgi:SAM-dependent methyltransferase
MSMPDKGGRTAPRFVLPARGALEANGPDDPLPYYYKPLVGALYRRRIEQALSLLRPPYGTVLEIGYGSGLLIPTLARFSSVVHGADIDSDPGRIGPRLAALGVQAELLRGDICRMDLGRERYDLVVAISVFEHIREIDAALGAIHRILRPGGELLVGMPRVDPFMSRLFDLIGFRGIDKHHVTSHRALLAHALPRFELAGARRMPGWLPACCGLYFSLCLRKTEGSGFRNPLRP